VEWYFSGDRLSTSSAESLLRELKRNGQLRLLCGFDKAPNVLGFQPFFKEAVSKWRTKITAIFDQMVNELMALLPDFGKHLAIDGKKLPTPCQAQ